MRIAVVGATGNTGTAVLTELTDRPEVDSILGIARRLPDQAAQPYRHADWATTDVQFDASQQTLAEAFADVDAVIHLAWLIQPNTQRELLRRVNVDGTRRVLEAAAEAGVQRIAVASSVGAYSPVSDDELRDESWPTGGIAGSHYSVDKAAQELVMDDFEATHPDISLARIRPALIFQSDAGAEIQRYFVGRWAPVQLLRHVRPPLLPLPNGLRAQAVHADDVARAYAEAVLRGAHGPFNICADDILDAATISRAVGRYRNLPLPTAPLRPLLKLAHRTGLVPADEGWLDMGVGVPLMDRTRAQQELGWEPRISGVAALKGLVDGMSTGRGRDSGPMRPRTAQAQQVAQLPAQDHRVSKEVDAGLLRQYLADHLTGATAGMKRIERMASAFISTPVYPELSGLATQIRAEHAYLQELIERQGFVPPFAAGALAWVGERAGRLKPNMRPPGSRSPSGLVLETEMMFAAVGAKLHGWKTMLDHAQALGVPRQVFEELIEEANGQLQTLQTVHEYARGRAFRKAVETFEPQAKASGQEETPTGTL